MMSKDTDDIKLIKKAIRGNSTAYGYLIEKHRTYLYKMAFLYTKNEQDALDVVGDTVLKGYLQIKTLKNASLFQTWITRVLINTAHDHRRKALSTLFTGGFRYRFCTCFHSKSTDSICRTF